jgi:hypothetical protein
MGQAEVKVPEKEVSARDQIRQQKRNIQHSIRNIEREKKRTEKEQEKMKKEIKKMVTAGQTKAARTLAKDIVRMKNQIEKMTQFCGQLKAVEIRVGSLSSLNELSIAMEEAGKAIMTVSSKLDAGKMQQLSKQLCMEDAKLDMKSEMMGEILDGMGESMDSEEQTDDIYNQVLQECGIKVAESLPDTGKKSVAKVEEKVEEEDSLDAMLKQLQK